MKLFYINVIEQNTGWGAEVFVNKGYHILGHETHTLDYRKYRANLASKFLEAPDFDALFLQRGDYFPIELLEACNRPRFFWASELVSRNRDQDRLFQCGLFKHIFVHSQQCKESVIQYKWAEPSSVSVLINGFDESVHRILPGIGKDIDILFIGSLTERRRKILDRLQQRFPLHITQVFGEELVKMFNRARIVLNIHAEDHLDTETRVFETLGCGACLVSEKLSAENPFQPGLHYAEAATLEDMEDKLAYYLSNDRKRQQLAEQGHQEAIQKHTYTARAKFTIDIMQRYLPEILPATPALNREKIILLQQQEQQQITNQIHINETNKLNIGIITTWFERGAAYVSRQYRDILRQKHNVFIYARGGESYAIGDPNWDDATVTWAPRVQNPLPTIIDLNHFRQWLQHNKIQVVFFNEQHWWPPVLGCMQLGIKTGAYIDYYTEQTIPIFNCYDFVICNTKKHLSAFDRHPQAFYIPWGTDTNLFKPADSPLAMPGIVSFFHSTGLNPIRKGTDTVLLAFSKLHGPCRLVLHTQIDIKQYLPALASLIDSMQSQGRLTLYQKTVPAPGLYHEGDVYVYPSRLEGIGLTIAEAMACGLPVITSGHAPMNEFITEESGVTAAITRLYARHDGYYWPQCMVDGNDLQEKMQTYIEEIDHLESKKRKVRSFAERNLNWQINAKNLPDLFVSAKKTPPPGEGGSVSFSADV